MHLVCDDCDVCVCVYVCGVCGITFNQKKVDFASRFF